MKFKEPSDQDHLFAVPAAVRPDINLNLSDVPPQELYPWMNAVNTGVTRWFDLVYGFAMDDAVRKGRDPREINRALEAGDLLMRAFFFELDRPDGATVRRSAQDFADSETAFVGTIDADGDLLYVSGGWRGHFPNAVMYRKRDDTYTPFLSQVVRGPDDDVCSVPIRQSLAYDPDRPYVPDAIPDELWAAYSLGLLANTAAVYLDAGVIMRRGRVYE